MCSLLCTMLTLSAQEAMPTRTCRPQLLQKGMPEHAQIRHRASAFVAPHAPLTRRAGQTNHMVGDRRQLVVMVAFPDRSFKGDEEETLAQWETIFNAPHYQQHPFHGSVRDYFYEQSYHQLRVTFDLSYLTLANPVATYRSTQDDDENSRYMMEEVAAHLKGLVEDWSPYDWNGDGYIDQIIIIYAGKGMNEGGGTMSIWPHQWWLSQHKGGQPVPVSSGGTDYLIDSYCCVPELGGDGGYSSFGTICHEYSHCFGFPDFYTGSTSYVSYWDVMDFGNYNGDGYRPCGYSAFERAFMGWMTPIELTSDTLVADMPSLAEHPIAYLVRNDGHPDEYYIVENRQQTGWDADLPGNGLLIFHVDYDADLFLYGLVNTSSKQHYTIFAANNRPQALRIDRLADWPYPSAAGNNALTNTSAPSSTLNNANTDGTKLMSKPLTDMAVTGTQASFAFMAHTTGMDDTPHVPSPRSAPVLFYDLHGRCLGTSFDRLPRGVYVAKYAHKVSKMVK